MLVQLRDRGELLNGRQTICTDRGFARGQSHTRRLA